MNKFGYRQGIISGIIISVCVVYLLRLFTYQVVSDKYKVMAENNSQRTETEYPARGLIYDRNNKLLVDNQAAYDLMIIPNQVKKFDTLELISILDITKESLEKGFKIVGIMRNSNLRFLFLRSPETNMLFFKKNFIVIRVSTYKLERYENIM